MSKMGQTIMEIQDLAYQGLPNKEIAKYTNTSESFVADVVRDFFASEFEPDPEPYFEEQDGGIYPGGCAQDG